MNTEALLRALLGVSLTLNSFYLGLYLRRRWHMVTKKRADKFAKLDDFAEAVHKLVHERGINVTGVMYDPEMLSCSSFNLGPDNCEGGMLQRAEDHDAAAIFLTRDSTELRRMARNGETS